MKYNKEIEEKYLKVIGLWFKRILLIQNLISIKFSYTK